LKSTYPRAAWRDGIHWENILYPLDHIAHVFKHAEEFDIIHVHLNRSQDYAALLFADLVKTPTVFTLHFLLPTVKDKSRKDRYEFLLKHRDHDFITISNSQRTLDLTYAATVYNGLNFDHFTMPAKPGKDLVWIGRFCHEKGTREAIEVARKTGLNLLLAGKIDKVKPEYYEYYKKEVEPFIDGKQIKYLGEVNDNQKAKLLVKAKALLVPINWNEPFGLTTIEAQACGVPVIAFNKGSSAEIVVEGKTGFIVENVNEMAKAVSKVDELNRNLIRQYTLSHFSATNMAENYEKVYHEVIKRHSRS
jgi:glycosyltransferase involved in cell wall biosynthesis